MYSVLVTDFIGPFCMILSHDYVCSPLASAFELVEQSHDLSSTSAAQWMTESNGSSIRIHFLHRNAQFFHTIHSLGILWKSLLWITGKYWKKLGVNNPRQSISHLTGECFVDLKHINIIYSQPCTRKCNNTLHLQPLFLNNGKSTLIRF